MHYLAEASNQVTMVDDKPSLEGFCNTTSGTTYTRIKPDLFDGVDHEVSNPIFGIMEGKEIL